MKKILRPARVDFKYLVFSEIYERYDDAKAKRKAFAIVEAAIACYARKGFTSITLDSVAREAGVSRSLVRHYFKDANSLRDTSFKYIRYLFQKMVVEQISKESRPDQALEIYVQSCFEWVDRFRRHSIVWWIYLLKCASDSTLREVHTVATQVGADRISHLLDLGVTLGLFSVNEDLGVVAKNIQTLISGSISVYTSEDLADPKTYRDQIVKCCLAMAGRTNLIR